MQRTTIAVTLLPTDTYIVGDRPHELYQPEEIVKKILHSINFNKLKAKRSYLLFLHNLDGCKTLRIEHCRPV